MKYEIKTSGTYRRDVKRMAKQGKDMQKMLAVINTLADGSALPPQYKDHALTGDFKGMRECHIEPDWLLVYQIFDDTLFLHLLRTGSHSDIFGL